MTHRKQLLAWLSLTLLATQLSACTDVGLYKTLDPGFRANKLTVSGTVCTDDPRQRNFPVKILFIVDTSLAVQSDANDATGYRGKAISEVLIDLGKNPNYHFGVIAFAGRARNLIKEGFTKDQSALAGAAMAVQSGAGLTSGATSGAGGCLPGGRCRDVQAAMSLASSIVTGDILAGDPGEIARTSYVMIFFSGGPPVPPIDRCACRDRQSETQEENWSGCPWDECDSVDSPVSVPDTFSEWTLPRDHNLDLSQTKPVNAGDTPGPCVATCTYYPGGGHTDSCEERVLVNAVRELKSFARENGAAELQFHTTYLPDAEDYSDPTLQTSQFRPRCDDAEADRARTVRLLSEMAFAGGGGFTRFSTASTITFNRIDLFTSRDPLVIKELVVTNTSVLTTSSGLQTDTDQDGLPDNDEETLGTCISDSDSDGDGLSDLVEIKLASDPLVPDEPIECIDLASSVESDEDLCNPGANKDWVRFLDNDEDTLNACEERLLGTLDSLFDSDADGIPDKVEFVAGTNYLASDSLEDIDFDGVVNREEVRGHTDPRANDAQTQLDLAYRYVEVDEGIKTVLSFKQPRNITGVSIRNVSSATKPGVGFLKFDPGPPPTLSWKDAEDSGPGGDYGPVVDISLPVEEGYQVSSCSKDPGTGTCTPESLERFITVMVDGPDSYPPKVTIDKIATTSAPRNCLRFRVRNITLMETGPDPDDLQHGRGNNYILIYFAQAPLNAKDGYGIFRVASKTVTYLKGPPEVREPKVAEYTFTDEDFVLYE